MNEFTIEEIGPTGWSASGLLRTPDFNINPLDRSTAGITLKTPFPRGGYYTLQFNVEYQDLPSNLHACVRALASLSWTVEGNEVQRLMHVMNGSCISGIGQSLTVKVIDDTLLGNAAVEPLPASFQYFVSMVVVAGSRPGQTHPLYLPSDCMQKELFGGDTHRINIPPNAGIDSFYIQTRGLNIAADAMNFIVSTEPMISSFDGQSVNRWIPLMPGSRRVVLKNQTESDVEYSIFFGIDG